MPTPIFPTPNPTRLFGSRGIAWGLTKKQIFKTRGQLALSGREAVLQDWTRPKVEITLKWNFLRNQRSVAANATPTAPKDEYRRIHTFFEARRGRFEPFFVSFTSDGDFYTVSELITASSPGVGTDPSNPDSRNYQMVRTFGGSTAPVGGIDTTTSTPIVLVGGSPVSSTLFNNPKDGWFRLAAAPSTGSEIRITAHYYYRVAFKRDENELETFADDFWRLKSVVMESRWW